MTRLRVVRRLKLGLDGDRAGETVCALCDQTAQCNVLHTPQEKGLQLLVVVSVLESLKDHRAEHEQGDNEDDEPLPDHSDYSLGGHEAREFLEPILDQDQIQRRNRVIGLYAYWLHDEEPSALWREVEESVKLL